MITPDTTDQGLKELTGEGLDPRPLILPSVALTH